MTPISAILWTRTSGEADVTVEVAPNPVFTPPVLQQTVSSGAANDFTLKTLVAPPVPNTTYTYRFRTGSALSDVGTFKTAPNPGAAQNVHFVWTTESDGTRLGSGAPVFQQLRNIRCRWR